jgi:hypothetical protein
MEEAPMELLSTAELKALAAEREWPCVSIYLPTSVVRNETEQNRIRFKNLLSRAEGQLTAAGIRSLDVKNLLDTAHKLLPDSLFWQYQGQGMAAFVSPSGFRYYRLPARFEELVVVGHRFHLKPLLRVASGNGLFFVLALSLHHARLLQCTRQSAREVQVPNMPESLEDAVLKYIATPESYRDVYAGAPAQARAKHVGVTHSHAPDESDVKQRVWEYCRDVDRALREPLRNQRAPLVLAGVDYVLTIFRDASTYKHIAEGAILGNPDDAKSEELQARAWEGVEPAFRAARTEAAELYGQLKGSKRASNDIKEVAPAAYSGRVYKLFVDLSKQQWGLFNPEMMHADLHQHRESKPGEEDLLDFAAVHTLMNDGEVYGVEADAVPGGGSVAAVFRY